ncbi:hypothetical protein [Brevundimonas sp.]|uniref:hypothetical protein n=1 Tax=Brevundimonas sp. TaxID=1871086 RepID=UPI00273793D4|nr:hypothetical protein [Brevundimonas sp.]MDP3801117.1 hypothetical protein [Brevundimonas sp.]
MIKNLFVAAAAGGLALAAAPAIAQNQDGLVNVNITDIDILRNSLNKNDVDVLNNLLANAQVSVPVVVQVPVGIAANVCGTTVAVLSAAGSGGACTATTASRALGNAINRQVIDKATTTSQ